MFRALLLVLLFAGSCKVEVKSDARRGDSKTPATGPVAQNPNCLKIVNGEKTNDFPSVNFLVNNIGNMCTGTWVGHNVLLAASHCLDPKALNAILVLQGPSVDTSKPMDYKPQVPVKVLYNGGAGITNQIHKNVQNELEDLSILIFKDNSAPAVTPIYPGVAPQSSKGTLVGYGNENLPGGKSEKVGVIRTKQIGVNNTVFSVPGFLTELYEKAQLPAEDIEGVLTLLGNPNDNSSNQAMYGSLASSGDSGGPIFVDGKIAGVASFVTRLSNVEASDPTIGGITVYVSLGSGASQALIEKAKAQGAVFATSGSVNTTDNKPTGSNGNDDANGNSSNDNVLNPSAGCGG
ncbi:MAG: trypsin-like serine protease [Oligoflexales bacterium]